MHTEYVAYGRGGYCASRHPSIFGCGRDGWFVVWARFVGGLSMFHLFLASRNRTTYEHFRMHYSSNQNPYDVGCLKNWTQICIGPRQPRIEEKLFEMKPQVINLT